MTKLNNGTTDIDNVVGSPNSTLGTDNVRTQTPERGRESIMANIKNRAATKYLAATLLATAPVAMTSCDEPVEPVEQVDTRSETQKYTPQEWLAKTGIKAEDTPEKGLGAITMLNTPVKGEDGLYYIKPDIRLNKDVIKELGLKVVQTSGRPIEEMHVYINFNNSSASIENQQGFEKSYFDVINHNGELRASQLNPNPFVTGKDMEKLYRPGSAFTVTISVRVRGDVTTQLQKEGIITVTNQQDFRQSSVFSYVLTN